MTLQEAIKEAIEGGWNTEKAKNPLFIKSFNELPITIDCAFLDPLFWQALGKSLGWGNEEYPEHEERAKTTFEVLSTDEDGREYEGFCPRCLKTEVEAAKSGCLQRDWLYYWHSFIDALAQGRTAEDWFEELK